jgi:serine/threonine protein kinase
MLCHYCGRDNRPTAKYCAYCQAPLSLTRPELQPGQLMDGGNYVIVRTLGKGGMGTVYLAEDKRAFDRLRVIKEIIDYFDPADPTARRKAAERFEAEARTLAMLKHPGIPDLIAYFSERGHNYLVMEYIEGENLAERLTHEDDQGRLVPGKPYPLEEALRYTIQIGEVLQCLAEHQPPVVHNDIKPANIIIEKGKAVLVDFGTARTRYAQPLGGQPDRRKASVYGTAGYAAPELYSGISEPRSDVYALAATAYHLLTDDDPRDHPAQFPKIYTLPPALVETLQQALAVDTAQRPTASQFYQQLEAFLAARESPIQPLTFPGDERATTREELIALCVKHWDYAADILYDANITNWLSKVLHDPVAAKEARAAINNHPQDRNAGLDAFIRALDAKAIPAPRLVLDTPRLDYGQSPTGQLRTQELKVRNAGGGYLYGTVASSVPWAKIVDGYFSCPAGQAQSILVTVDTGGMTPGTFYHGSLALTTPYTQPLTIPIGLSVCSLILQLDRKDLSFGSIPKGLKSIPPLTFTVINQGQSEAICRIADVPNWLFVSPDTFRCPPGGRKKVEVMVVPKALAEERTYTTLLKVEAPGVREAVVRVNLRLGQPHVGLLLNLLQSIWWFFWTTLPSAISSLLQRLAWTVALVIWPLAIVVWYFTFYSPGRLPINPTPTVEPPGYDKAVEALNGGNTVRANDILADLEEPLSKGQVWELADLLNDKMAQVPEGEYIIGSTPPERVKVGAFRIDVYEVTNVQYLAFVQGTGHAHPPPWSGSRYPQGKALHPVAEVTWQDAEEYCAWAGKRLPGEEEWEAAARGPSGFMYPWGNTPGISPARANYGNSKRDTTPVGSYPQGASVSYKTMDMIGNVEEWTSKRTIRGGSWQTPGPNVTTSRIGAGSPDYTYVTVGFRCAMN